MALILAFEIPFFNIKKKYFNFTTSHTYLKCYFVVKNGVKFYIVLNIFIIIQKLV